MWQHEKSGTNSYPRFASLTSSLAPCAAMPTSKSASDSAYRSRCSKSYIAECFAENGTFMLIRAQWLQSGQTLLKIRQAFALQEDHSKLRGNIRHGIMKARPTIQFISTRKRAFSLCPHTDKV
jgi:hypothetical protein